MKLTKRLAAAASFIPAGKAFADIGTDHGYIPVYMCSEGGAPQAIAADIGEGPLLAAKSHVESADLGTAIECRLGDGLTCLQPGEVAGAVICGMGGPLMVQILKAAPTVWQEMEFLVLHPQSDSAALRQFLYDHGWHLDRETLVVDDGRLYEIMRAVPGKEAPLAPWQYAIGPLNWAQQEPLLVRKIGSLIEKNEHIIKGLQKSATDKSALITQLQEENQAWRNRIWQLQSETQYKYSRNGHH